MKIIVLPFFLFLVLVATFSCGKKAMTEQEKRVADSLYADSVRKADSLAFIMFSTPDLDYNGLHGHVKTVIDLPNARFKKTTKVYDKEGNWKQINGRDPFKRVSNRLAYYERDSEGRPYVEKQYGETIYFLWDGKHCVGWKNETYGESSLTDFNEMRNSFKETIVFKSGTKRITTYKALKLDEIGNWLERESTDVDYDKNGKQTYTGKFVSKREITYYSKEELGIK